MIFLFYMGSKCSKSKSSQTHDGHPPTGLQRKKSIAPTDSNLILTESECRDIAQKRTVRFDKITPVNKKVTRSDTDKKNDQVVSDWLN